MRPVDITAVVVRQTLSNIRSARSLATSPLLALDALAGDHSAAGGGDSAAARTTFLRGWLEGIVWEQLMRLRGGPGEVDARRPGVAEALAQLAVDYRADSIDREAWGSLYYHYFSGSSATRGQVAAAVGVGYNTVRRRLERGDELLANVLRARERAAAAASEHTHNVPRPPTRFIGRETELGAIRSLMAEHRLVVLTGLGGIGKSRLAIHLAQDLAADYPDGAWFVELATILDGHRLPSAVLATLGQREITGQTTLQTVTSILSSQRLLLVLDNCEHIAAECTSLLDHLRQHCPTLEVLATSRETLPVAGAAHWPVPPLALPTPEVASSRGRLLHFDGPRLFNSRAMVAAPDFALTDTNAAEVDRICWQLDGIPLALEMAAGRMGDLSLEQLETGLADRFAVLRDGRHAARPGHETLKATMDWSYRLLTEPEQRLFRRLTVFRGGCTAAAAEAVCARDGIDSPAVQSLLDRLVAKSLVYLRQDTEPRRYQMLETVRHYAHDQLVVNGEAERWQNRHLTHYETLADAMSDCLFATQKVEQSPEILQELDNFRAAMAWARHHQSEIAGARIASTLLGLWERKGLDFEAQGWLQSFLAVADDRWPADVHAAALYAQVKLGLRQGDLDAAIANSVHARELFDTAGIPVGVSACDALIGHILQRQGRRAEAVERLSASRSSFQALGHKNGLADVNMRLAMAIDKKQSLQPALDLFAEAEALFRELGKDRGVAAVLVNRGFFFMSRGRVMEARPDMELALGMWRSIGDTFNLCSTLLNLGSITLDQGDVATAQLQLDECLVLAHKCGAKVQVGHVLVSLSDIASAGYDDDAAHSQALQALEIGREVGDTQLYANAVITVAELELQQGRIEEARGHVAEGLQLGVERSLRGVQSAVLALEGWLHTLDGAFPAAHASLGRGLRLARDIGAEHAALACFESYLRLAAAERQSRHALVLAGAAEARRAANDLRLTARQAEALAALLAPMRAAGGDAVAEDALTIGCGTTFDESVAFALGELTWDDLRDAVAMRMASADGVPAP